MGPGALFRVYAAIYSATASLSSPEPRTRMSNMAAVTLDSSDPNTDDLYITISWDSATFLVRNRIFFVAFFWMSQVPGLNLDFYGSLNVGDQDFSSMVWTETNTNLPLTANAVEDPSGAFWFILYGNQYDAGVQQGPTGAPGIQGLDGCNSMSFQYNTATWPLAATAWGQLYIDINTQNSGVNSVYVTVTDPNGTNQSTWFNYLRQHLNTPGNTAIGIIRNRTEQNIYEY